VLQRSNLFLKITIEIIQ